MTVEDFRMLATYNTIGTFTIRSESDIVKTLVFDFCRDKSVRVVSNTGLGFTVEFRESISPQALYRHIETQLILQ